MEWSIGRNSKQCATCDRAFTGGDEFFSALYDDGDKFFRRDFCANCWDGCGSKAIFSFWKARVLVENKDTHRVAFDADIILDLFLRIESKSAGSVVASNGAIAPESVPDAELDVNRTSAVNLQFVLALFLMRKKIFKLKHSCKVAEGEKMVFYFPKGKRDVEVINPELTPDEIERITEKVKTLFEDHD